MNFESLKEKTLDELRHIGKDMGIKAVSKYRKSELIEQILNFDNKKEEKEEEVPEVIEKVIEEEVRPAIELVEKIAPKPRPNNRDMNLHDIDEDKRKKMQALLADSDTVEGIFEHIDNQSYGFLRIDNYQQGQRDIYVSPSQIRKFGLRTGDKIKGKARFPKETEKYKALVYLQEVNGGSPDRIIGRSHFDDLTPIYPDKKMDLETIGSDMSTRLIDILSPVGRGQRGMIVAPPKAGKTVLIKKIANAIAKNHPDIELIVLLIDERPEEVTDMKRSIKGDVVYSTFDEEPDSHARVAKLTLERAKRLVEMKKDVVILMDSLTRLARAYNLIIQPTGRTLSGGLDPGALTQPKKFFGAARNLVEGGSLTILATSLVETGSRMDEVIFEEFKGTGNMELHLDRRLQERRIFPAIDINKSGTRREDLILTPEEISVSTSVRRLLSNNVSHEATEKLLNIMTKTQSNKEFVDIFPKIAKDENLL
ncbi:transcription termination factor Rho [Clostridium cylindrosporum]|uniref:Transcription termination factor Rho n=1 Tax=Clostridium cylindrosporum DSM 605 TaxID=1121307 RepID=A0A0J8G566_CLOCY|nr:transcription termination factor Rho [Clostridium cylindrosporum]KMT22806.1 transcription termination factor Rho [Clostridium cylindrosporum DSM 605]